MEYTEVEINGFKWLLPSVIAHKVGSELKEPDLPLFALTDRNSRIYIEDLLEGNTNLLDGKVVVDICSGSGNLDDLASNTLGFIRVDTKYSHNFMINNIKRNSKTPSKFTFNTSTGFALNLPDDCADLVLEN